MPTYEITGVTISATEETAATLSFVLYGHRAGKETTAVAPENVDEVLEKLPLRQYTIPEGIKQAEQKVSLYVQFAAEGRKDLALLVRYTAKKRMHDNTFGTEFAMERKECISFDVLCPFEISCEWLSTDPTILPMNTSHLSPSKSATLCVKMTARGGRTLTVHDTSVKLSNDFAKPLEDAPGANSWPTMVGAGEQLAVTFSVLPTGEFKCKRIGNVEIIWSRLAGSEKSVCTLPLRTVTATESCLEVSLSPPTRAVKLEEFEVTLRVRNVSENVVETKVVMEESPDFFVAGEVCVFLTMPPETVDELRYTLVPLKCGNLDLPKPVVYLLSNGKVVESVTDKDLEQAIYVFPSQQLTE